METIPNWMHEHMEEDSVRFKSIDDKQDAILVLLDAQKTTFEEHQAKVEPYLQGAAGLGVVWKALVAIGGAVILWSQIKAFVWPK